MLARNDKIKKRNIPRYVSTFHFDNDTASEQKVNFSWLPGNYCTPGKLSQANKSPGFQYTLMEKIMPTDVTQYAIPAAAFLVGFLISFLILKSKNTQTSSALGKEISELNDSLKSTEEELAYATNNHMASQEKTEGLEIQKKDLETRLTASEKEAGKIPQLETERDESRRIENELQQKISELSDQLAIFSEKDDDSQKLVDELAEQKTKVEELEKAVLDSETQRAADDDKLNEHQKLVDEHEEQKGKIAELEATIAEYSEKLAESDTIKTEQQALADELAAHKTKIETLEQTLRDTEEELGQTLQDYETHLAESTEKQESKEVTTEPDQATLELQKIIDTFSAKIAREVVQ